MARKLPQSSSTWVLIAAHASLSQNREPPSGVLFTGNPKGNQIASGVSFKNNDMFISSSGGSLTYFVTLQNKLRPPRLFLRVMSRSRRAAHAAPPVGSVRGAPWRGAPRAAAAAPRPAAEPPTRRLTRGALWAARGGGWAVKWDARKEREVEGGG